MKKNIITIGKYLLAALPGLLLAGCAKEESPAPDGTPL